MRSRILEQRDGAADNYPGHDGVSIVEARSATTTFVDGVRLVHSPVRAARFAEAFATGDYHVDYAGSGTDAAATSGTMPSFEGDWDGLYAHIIEILYAQDSSGRNEAIKGCFGYVPDFKHDQEATRRFASIVEFVVTGLREDSDDVELLGIDRSGAGALSITESAVDNIERKLRSDFPEVYEALKLIRMIKKAAAV